ncbi:hypothetical protein E3N88_26381 [Mikania micrantha]|uniref:Uncharacterized protein n=1 Tax=Mikania micrantha TaxID=192012 RepID=A0A5N6N8F7_9ASTR|nr:hypothetical protein E3N88_26381 [Mikania micrantha]
MKLPDQKLKHLFQCKLLKKQQLELHREVIIDVPIEEEATLPATLTEFDRPDGRSGWISHKIYVEPKLKGEKEEDLKRNCRMRSEMSSGEYEEDIASVSYMLDDNLTEPVEGLFVC